MEAYGNPVDQIEDSKLPHEASSWEEDNEAGETQREIWKVRICCSADCKMGLGDNQDLLDLVEEDILAEADKVVVDQARVGEAGGRDYHRMAKVQGATMTCLRLDV